LSETAQTEPLGEAGVVYLRNCLDLSELHFGVKRQMFGWDMYFEDTLAVKRGIPNIGNTCFANALLQVILRIEPLDRLLASHASRCRSSDRCLMCVVADQASALRGRTEVHGSPVAILARQGFFGPEFKAPMKRSVSIDLISPAASSSELLNLRAGMQCDAQDFLRNFISAIVDAEPRVVQDADPDFFLLYGDRSVLANDIFGLVYRTRRRCFSCKDTMDKLMVECSVLLTVPRALSNSSVSLRTLWASFFEEECSDENSRCPRLIGCGGRSSRQRFLEREPPVLTIVLQRGWETWSNQGVCVGRGKSHASVEFPASLDFLRTGPYDLAGIVHHIGESSSSGHYLATCKVGMGSSGDPIYGVFNDDRPVSILASDITLSGKGQKTAYLLVYTRRCMWQDDVRDGTERVPYERGDATREVLELRNNRGT
jgi:ubiquitin C-terminal hydrolase